MAANLEPTAAAAVVALATFQLWQSWQGTAPTLAGLREYSPNNITAKQQLMDADLTVGSLALIVGVAMAIYTRDLSILVLMVFSFGALSLWYHAVLASAPTTES